MHCRAEQCTVVFKIALCALSRIVHSSAAEVCWWRLGLGVEGGDVEVGTEVEVGAEV